MPMFFIYETEKDYANYIFSFSSRVAQKKYFALICPDEEIKFQSWIPPLLQVST
jgi:hypothetical protein